MIFWIDHRTIAWHILYNSIPRIFCIAGRGRVADSQNLPTISSEINPFVLLAFKLGESCLALKLLNVQPTVGGLFKLPIFTTRDP